MRLSGQDPPVVSLVDEAPWTYWIGVVARSLLVGAVAGIIGGALIFFLFGFIGLSGASFSSRLENGWQAATETGLGKGVVSGLALAVGLVLTIAVLAVIGRRVDPPRARPWLALLAGLLVLTYNRDSLRTRSGWDPAGLATVVGIAVLVGLVVWWASPWVLGSPGSSNARESRFDESGAG